VNQSQRTLAGTWFDEAAIADIPLRWRRFVRRIDSATGLVELVFRMDLGIHIPCLPVSAISVEEKLRSLLSDPDVVMSTTYGNAASKPGFINFARRFP